jgi:N-methylhydantoinase B
MSSFIQDPIALEILWERCISIVDQAAATLVRTAFSTITRESGDYGCVLCDVDGLSLCNTTRGTPPMAIIIPRTIRSMLEKIPAGELAPGDIIFTNDPYYGAGHLPDFCVAMPVFRNGRLVAFTGACSHVADAGGAIAPDAREAYEEGICFPPVRLFRNGVPDPVIFSIIEKNVRVPEQVIGDMNALVASCRTSAAELIKLMDETGMDDLRPLSHTLNARTEEAFRAAVKAIPEGTYCNSIVADGYRHPITLKCAITVRGGDIDIDCTGTSPQVSPGGVNVVYNFAYAFFCYTLKCILDPHTPYNEGLARPIRLHVPEGTVLNPRFPAPVFARNQTAHYLPALVMGALACAIPDKVMAACGSPANRTVFTGSRGHDGRPFSFMMIMSGGMGACRGQDGYSCTPYPSNSGAPPVEVVETVVPLTIRRKAYRPNSGGAGAFRGGLGIEFLIENNSDRAIHVSSRMDRIDHPPEGLHGGQHGGAAGIWRNGTAPFPSKGREELHPGEYLVIHSPGGGGFGHARERDSVKVQEDLREGYVTREHAIERYGWKDGRCDTKV